VSEDGRLKAKGKRPKPKAKVVKKEVRCPRSEGGRFKTKAKS